MKRFISIVTFATMLGGCAFGRTVGYSGSTMALQGVSSKETVALGVQDSRSYVVSGRKPATFVGLMRGGYGNPFDVNTSSGQPMATEMRDALAASIKAKNIEVSTVVLTPSADSKQARQALAASHAHRAILVTLNEWKSDTFFRIALFYDVTVEIMDEAGNVVATNTIKGRDNLGAELVTPDVNIMAAFVQKMDLLFSNDQIVAALK